MYVHKNICCFLVIGDRLQRISMKKIYYIIEIKFLPFLRQKSSKIEGCSTVPSVSGGGGARQPATRIVRHHDYQNRRKNHSVQYIPVNHQECETDGNGARALKIPSKKKIHHFLFPSK